MWFSLHWSFVSLLLGLQVLEREIECWCLIMHSIYMVLMTCNLNVSLFTW